MPKRSFPFDGTSPLQLKTHINAFYVEKTNNMDKIYARTRKLMHEGSLRLQKDQANQSNNVQTEQSFKCQRCVQSKFGVSVSCVFCERQTCADCSRQCAHCGRMFCCLCSIANYDERCERYYCFGCLER